jgi:hypothetical protein
MYIKKRKRHAEIEKGCHREEVKRTSQDRASRVGRKQPVTVSMHVFTDASAWQLLHGRFSFLYHICYRLPERLRFVKRFGG